MFETYLFKLQLRNCKESWILMCPIVIAVNFSGLLAKTFGCFSSDLRLWNRWWESYPLKLWKKQGILNVLLYMRLQCWCAAPLNLPVQWQWSLTIIWFLSLRYFFSSAFARLKSSSLVPGLKWYIFE